MGFWLGDSHETEVDREHFDVLFTCAVCAHALHIRVNFKIADGQKASTTPRQRSRASGSQRQGKVKGFKGKEEREKRKGRQWEPESGGGRQHGRKGKMRGK